MAVYSPCYCTRADVKYATEVFTTSEYDGYVDAAIQGAREAVDGLCKRRFYNVSETIYIDWPNYQYAYPWRIWLDAKELADTTVNVPVVSTGVAGGHLAGTVIPSTAIFWGPANYSPPFTYIELDRSQSFTFGTGPTPQRDVSITGTFGYWAQTKSAGTLAVAISSSSATTMTVSNGVVLGVGDTVTIDSERILLSDVTWADSGQAQIGSGCTTQSDADNQLTVTTGSSYSVGELIQLDSETMRIASITGNILTVQRAFDGTVLATHSTAEVFAQRLFTILRGQFGSTAATHLISAPITALIYPAEVHNLAVAEALNTIIQQTSSYSMILERHTTLSVRASGENAPPPPAGGLLELRDLVYTRYGRKARQRVI